MPDPTPLEHARSTLATLNSPNLDRRFEVVSALATEGSLAALISIAESLESIDESLGGAKRRRAAEEVRLLERDRAREASRRVVERMGPATDSRDAEVLPR